MALRKLFSGNSDRTPGDGVGRQSIVATSVLKTVRTPRKRITLNFKPGLDPTLKKATIRHYPRILITTITTIVTSIDLLETR